MGFLSNMMKAPVPGSRGAQFGSAMGDMAPLLFSMAQGLRSGKGAAAYAPQGLAAMMYQQQLEEEQKMSEEERAYRRQQDARTWGWRESERAREDELRNAAQAGLAEALGGFNTTGVTDPARQAFDSLQTAWGSPLKVNSAYRSPEHNARVGGAKNSQHTHGNAFDVDVSGMSREERLRLIQEARRNGFRGIGVYDNALHFDVGPARAWGADYSSKSLPEWAMGAATGPINGIPAGQPSQPTGQPRLSPERAAAILSNPYASEAARNLVLSQFMPKEDEKPQIVKGADGYNYWVTPDGRSMRAVPEAKAAGALPSVGAQEIFQNGTIVQSTPMGPRVWLSDGTQVTGAAARKAIQEANDYEVSLANDMNYGRRAGTLDANIALGGEAAASERAGSQAIDMSKDAFEALGKVQQNIANLSEVTDLIKRGAKTGPLAQYVPNITSASVEMNNMQGRLGLDVVGAVTFGALSEGELNLALSTALPINLDEPALADWVVRKVEAQTKLAGYFEDQAKFLSKPGNTLNDWLEENSGRSGYDVPATPDAIMGMSAAEIDGLISKGLTDEQYNAAVARLQQLAAGGAK